MYRTGDLGRVLPNGEFEFRGRTDRQVKVRGFRVELGEIEQALRVHEAVGAAAVTLIDDPFGKRLVAYVAPAPGRVVEPVELRHWVATTLPPYLRPNNYVLLDHLPLDPNGKISRADLPATWSTRAAAVHLPPYAPPANELEGEIANVFEDVLAIDRVGRNDDFFALGGDSLRSVQMIACLRDIGSGSPPGNSLADRRSRRSAPSGRDPDAPGQERQIVVVALVPSTTVGG